MQEAIRNFNELADSREMLEARTPPAISVFLAMLTALLAVAFAWAYFGETDVVVRARGIVRPAVEVSTVANKVPAKVEAVHVKTGDRVRAGQPLYTLETEDLEVRRSSLERQRSRLEADLAALERLRGQLAESGEASTPVDAGVSTDAAEVGDSPLARKLRLQWESASRRLALVRRDLERTERLERSVLEGRNFVPPDDAEGYARYREFELTLAKYEEDLRIAKEAAVQMAAEGGDLEKAKRRVEEALRARDQYVNDVLLRLRAETEGKVREEQDLREQLDGVLVSADESVRALRDELRKTEEELRSLEIALRDRDVRAPIDGIVHVTMPLSKGDLLQAGAAVMTIVPEDDGALIVQLMLENRDIADVREGARVKFHFDALPFQDYGELYGTVKTVAADATVDPETGASYYRAEAVLENRTLVGRKGEPGRVRVGMTAEALIVTGSEKILHTVLRKLDLRE